MNQYISKIVFAITVLTLAAMACSSLSLPSVPGVSGSNSGSGGGSTTGSALFQDDFSGNQTWGTGTDTDSSVEYVNSGLQMVVFTPLYIVYSTPGHEQYENVHIEAKVQNDSIDNGAGFGIICDQQVTQSAYYFLGVAPNGNYEIAKASVAKDNVTLSSGTSDKIPTDAKSYTIGADCGNGKLALYVNGQLIDTASDTDYAKGGVGLFAWSGDKKAGTNVTFDDFVMTPLP